MTTTVLQFGVPGGFEFLAILLGLVILSVFIGRWVYRDGTLRGNRWAWQWAMGVSLLCLFGVVPGLLALTAYVVFRGKPAAAVPS